MDQDRRDRITDLRTACWRSVEHYTNLEMRLGSQESQDGHDSLLWNKDLSPHAAGEFSIGVQQANGVLEDYSQVETGSFGTFVGIYDGHAGPEAACFVSEKLFPRVKMFAQEYGGVSDYVLLKAFQETEEEFLSLVLEEWQAKKHLATVGSCCLVGAICGSTLIVASLGDSRAVLGSLAANDTVEHLQISEVHNASRESIRSELTANFPNDNSIVQLKYGVWRVKGVIQISRSIGDIYLKRPDFNRDPPPQRSWPLSEPITEPVLSAEPSICSRVLQAEDRFVIFASDGLWEHVTDQQAVDIVHKHERFGSARRLIKVALQEAARKRGIQYHEIQKIKGGYRRHYHDDITVVVLYLDHKDVTYVNDIASSSVKPPVDIATVNRTNSPQDDAL